jgi:RNA polymerase-binding transcription factor DksA
MDERGIRKYGIFLRPKHECRKCSKEINMARKQVKPRVHTCRN